MTSPDTLRDRFAAGNIQTASPSKVVTMCFDRLDRDLAMALAAIEKADHYECNEALSHAQDLLAEMAGMLDLGVWEHAGSLVALYDYLIRLLTAANAVKNAGLVIEAQHIVTEIGDGFRAAAQQPTGQGIVQAAADQAPRPAFDPAPRFATGTGDGEQPAPNPGDRPRLSIQA